VNLDPTWLFLSLIPGAIGFVLFVYGKKQERWLHVATGLSLMVYPYFVGNAVPMLLVGAAVVGGLWLAELRHTRVRGYTQQLSAKLSLQGKSAPRTLSKVLGTGYEVRRT